MRAYLQGVSNSMDDDDRQRAKFAVAFVDLDGDGVDEAIVYGPNDGHCGTGGCGIGILVRHGARYRLKCSTTIGWPPVGVLRTKHYGWRDITVLAAGGGIRPGYRSVLSFNGSWYPLNPTVPPAKPISGHPVEDVLIERDQSGVNWVKLFP